jgi:peptidoglycan/xylan/chitin deacetylase (PgdA/CDA1 family)
MGCGYAAALTFDDGYADNLEHGVTALASEGVVGTVYVVVSQIGVAEGRFAGSARMLNLTELRDLQLAGWEIGSHTFSHPRLCDLDEAAQRREIVESKARLEDSLAYPYGLYDERTLRIAEEAEYTHAVTTAKRGGSDSPFAIPRISLGGYGARALKQSIKLKLNLLRQTKLEQTG